MMALYGGDVVEMMPEEAWERLESMRWNIGTSWTGLHVAIGLRIWTMVSWMATCEPWEEMIQQSAQLHLTQRQQMADLALLTTNIWSGIPPSFFIWFI